MCVSMLVSDLLTIPKKFTGYQQSKRTMAVLSDLTVTIFLYVCVTTCFLMVVARMAVSWKTNKRWTIEDGWMLGALCFLVGLLYSGHGIKYDTNNVQNPELLKPDEVERRVLGSKTVLVGRLCYASAYVEGATSLMEI